MNVDQRTRYTIVALAALIAITVFAISASQSQPNAGWRSEYRQIDQMLEQLASAPPNDTSTREWEAAIGRLSAGFWNACHSEVRVSQEQLAQLKKDIEAILENSEVSYSMLVSIWDTIGTSSDAAEKHIATFRSDFLDHLPSEFVE